MLIPSQCHSSPLALDDVFPNAGESVGEDSSGVIKGSPGYLWRIIAFRSCEELDQYASDVVLFPPDLAGRKGMERPADTRPIAGALGVHNGNLEHVGTRRHDLGP